jgi:tetratricopeptide (TPR) repeat protein
MRSTGIKYKAGFILMLWLTALQVNGQFSSPLPNTSTKFSGKARFNPADQYLDSAEYLSKQFPLRAIDKINKAIELSIMNSDRSTEGYAYLVLGNLQQKLGQHELAVDNYRKCIAALGSAQKAYVSKSKRMSREPVDSRIYAAYRQMASSLSELNKPDEAIAAINTCLGENFSSLPAEEHNETKRLLAEIKLKQGKFAESMQIYEQVLQNEKENGNAEGEIKSLMGLGKAYQLQKNLQKATEYYTQAKNISEKNSKQALLIQCNDLLAEIFRQQKKVEEEVSVRSGNILLNNSSNNPSSNIRQNYEIGNAYVNTNQLEKAVPYLQKSYTDLTSDANTSFYETRGSNGTDQSADALKLLTTAYLKKGESAKAMAYFIRYTKLMDSIRELRKAELEQALSIGTSLGKNQQRIDLLEKERQLNVKSIDLLQKDKSSKEDQLNARNMIIGTLVFCILFLLAGGFLIARNAIEKRKANQLLAIKSLRGQMNPHFIFNALNSVNHYISMNDERAANKYLADFSKLMRSVMDSSKHDFIALSGEIDTLKLYLELEHARFRDKFDYTFTVGEAVHLSDFELPPMMIQPYIENAVWHGLRYVENKGKLEVNFLQKENELHVTVTDNGIGRKRSAEIKTRSQKSQASAGTANIENRVKVMNELYRLNIRVNSADAFPALENPGTRVEIIIPKKI